MNSKPNSEILFRLAAQLDASGLHEEILADILYEEGCECEESSILKMLEFFVGAVGVERAVLVFQENEFNVSLGPYIVKNNRNGEFFCKDFGWVDAQEAATGFYASEIASDLVHFLSSGNQWYWHKPKDNHKHGPYPDKETAAGSFLALNGFPIPKFVSDASYAEFENENNIIDMAA